MKQPTAVAGLNLLLLFSFFLILTGCKKTDNIISRQNLSLVGSTPTANQSDSPFDHSITATFNEALDSLKYNTVFSLKHQDSLITGKISTEQKTIIFEPDSELLPSTNYTAVITITERNKNSFPAYSYEWKFTTKGPDQYQMTKRSEHVTDFVRDGTRSMQIGNYLYSFGGWNVPERSYNDVYRSSGDLQNWEKLPNAPWHGRHVFGIAKLGDTTYILGGDNLQSQFDVWRTTDGENWTKMAENLLGDRVYYGCTAHKSYLYIVGGAYMHDVWRSRDGAQWEQVTENVPFLNGENYAGSLASYKDRLWMICGGGDGFGSGIASKKVWSSSDGKIWKEEKEIPGYGRQYTDVCVWDNKLWVIGGYHSEVGNLKSIMYMKPNGTWVELETPSDYIGRHATGVAVYNNRLVITCGNYNNDCWVIEKTN